MNFRFVAFATVEAAEEAFYDAMRNADLDAMMRVWADEEDVVCIHPNGPRLLGLEAIRTSWQAILGNGAVPVRTMEAHGTTASRFAVRSVIEEISVRNRQGTERVRCFATNVYVREINGWRMLSHHSSPAGTAVVAEQTPRGEVLH